MGQVSVTLNNRTYRLACNDGEEARLKLLLADVKTRVESLSREFGQSADERILLMAAVLLADELMDLREAHEAMLQAAADVLRDASQPDPGKPDSTRVDRAKGETARADPSKADASKSDLAKSSAASQQQARAKG